MRALFLVFFFILSSPLVSKPKIIEARLNLYPHTGGSFRSAGQTFYYCIGARNISILNQSFVLVQSFQFSPGTSIVDFGDINGDGLDDIVEVRRTDILARYQAPTGGFELPVKLVGGDFISPPGTQRVEQFSFLHDVNHDGYAELTIPAETMYVHFGNQRGSLVKTATFNCPYESTYSDRYWSNSDLRANRIQLRTSIPSIYFQDLNHDGIDDAYCRFKSLVYYFISDKDEHGKLTPFLKKIMRSYPADLQREYASSFTLRDLDHDGNPEAVFSVVSGLGIKIKTDVQVFWGKETLPDSSSMVKWTIDGGIFTPLFLESRKSVQLLVPALDLGVSFFLSYVLEKKMRVAGSIYSLENHKSAEKIATHELSFRVLDNFFPGFTTGDFNGDGFSDVAIASELNELEIYFGSENMKARDILTLPLPGYGIIENIINSNGKNELLIYLPQKIPGYDSQMVYLVRFD